MGLTNEEKLTLIAYRLNKSDEVFTEALDVISLGHWNWAVNRLYYSIFHVCNALLLSTGHSAHTHSGVIRIIMLEFVKTGRLTKEEGTLLTSLFNMRNTGDYDDLFDWSEAQIIPLVEPAKKLQTKLHNMVVEIIKADY